VTIQDPAEKGFTTDQDDLAEIPEVDEHATDGLAPDTTTHPDSAAVFASQPDLSALDIRPSPGKPREYHFPRFERHALSNGMTLINAHVPGRALIAAQLLLPGGGWTEPHDLGGVTVLTGRAMTEGTARRDANEFIEASERLGAEIHADATWEALSASLEVPRSRFGAALALLAEMVFEPAFPETEVNRLREERLNDLLQAWSDPRRRAERVFPETIFVAGTPYRRPLGGIQSTVGKVDREALLARHQQLLDPSSATLIVAGDLAGASVLDMAEEHMGSRSAAGGNRPAGDQSGNAVKADGRGGRVVLVDRPGAPQSELRIGHIGVQRKTPDFHAIAVLNAILGGTFNSRLNRVIREERGYTYGISSAFDMRSRPGPFVIRTAVESAATVPAILDTLQIVRDIRESEVQADELAVARDYLVGVFPLRFESAAQVASALGGLTVFGLPDDELDRYRPSVAAVTAADVLAAAGSHIRPDELSIVVIGDVEQVEPALSAVSLGELTVISKDATPE
jgi:zinc protease